MTYCVGLRLSKGLVFMSDSLTNAGVDNISRYRKMFTWNRPGERLITLMTAGNLATTQSVVGLLEERAKSTDDPNNPTILNAPTMFQVARLVGTTLRTVIQEDAVATQQQESTFSASMILGGQIKGGRTHLFLIYPEGNFIETSRDQPFLQIGETKYGRPILVRAFDANMSYEDAVKLLAVSFESTIRANLSVGMPLDVQVYEKDQYELTHEHRFDEDDVYFRKISHFWGDALRTAFNQAPEFKFPPQEQSPSSDPVSNSKITVSANAV